VRRVVLREEGVTVAENSIPVGGGGKFDGLLCPGFVEFRRHHLNGVGEFVEFAAAQDFRVGGKRREGLKVGENFLKK